MTDFELYLKGAKDAWELAQRYPELLDTDYMTARGVEKLVAEMDAAFKEEPHES